MEKSNGNYPITIKRLCIKDCGGPDLGKIDFFKGKIYKFYILDNKHCIEDESGVNRKISLDSVTYTCFKDIPPEDYEIC